MGDDHTVMEEGHSLQREKIALLLLLLLSLMQIVENLKSPALITRYEYLISRIAHLTASCHERSNRLDVTDRESFE